MTLDSEQRSAQPNHPADSRSPSDGASEASTRRQGAGAGGRTSPQEAANGHASGGQSVHYSTARHGNHVEASPDLLRWRADVLLDEMMLGAVDVSAADEGYTAKHANGAGDVEAGAQDAHFGGAYAEPPYNHQADSDQPYGDYSANSYDGSRYEDSRNGVDATGYPGRNSLDWHPREPDRASPDASNTGDSYGGDANSWDAYSHDIYRRDAYGSDGHRASSQPDASGASERYTSSSGFSRTNGALDDYGAPHDGHTDRGATAYGNGRDPAARAASEPYDSEPHDSEPHDSEPHDSEPHDEVSSRPYSYERDADGPSYNPGSYGDDPYRTGPYGADGRAGDAHAGDGRNRYDAARDDRAHDAGAQGHEIDPQGGPSGHPGAVSEHDADSYDRRGPPRPNLNGDAAPYSADRYTPGGSIESGIDTGAGRGWTEEQAPDGPAGFDAADYRSGADDAAAYGRDARSAHPRDVDGFERVERNGTAYRDSDYRDHGGGFDPEPDAPGSYRYTRRKEAERGSGDSSAYGAPPPRPSAQPPESDPRRHESNAPRAGDQESRREPGSGDSQAQSSYPARSGGRTESRTMPRPTQDEAFAQRNRFEDEGSYDRPRSIPNVAPWRQNEQAGAPRDARPLEDVRSNTEPTTSTETPPRGDRLYSLEQRYEQFRREQQSSIRPTPAKHPEPVDPTPPRPSEPPQASAASAGAEPRTQSEGRSSSQTGGEQTEELDQTRWAYAPEKWLRQNFSEEDDLAAMNGAAPQEQAVESNEPDPAVRQDQAGFVSAMSVRNSKRRSNLLPRMSTLDVDTLNREISELHGELAELLPVGHEINERARHLLDKAYSILQSDPMRSAEVEYYMQQVRTIVQRQRQARDWSALYRDRLRVYLLSWASLAGLILAARYIFQTQTEAFLVTSMGLESTGLIMQHWSAFWGAGMAGALGGALGALYTMHQHLRHDQGLFDRKYGLRGLMLPIIGLIVGWLGYAGFALVYSLFQINPAVGLLAGTLPALVAFAFGFSQESIYGTRD